MKLKKLIRSSKDIGIFAKKGVGKSTVLALLGFFNYYTKYTDVYSNMPLNYPHIFIESLEDFDKITFDGRRKLFIGDDFEYWFSSNVANKTINNRIEDILIFWGKKYTSLVYSAKREMIISKSLRESTMEFWELELRQKVFNPNPVKNNILKDYLNFLKIRINRFDENLNPLPYYEINNLEYIVDLFDTTSTLSKLTLTAPRSYPERSDYDQVTRKGLPIIPIGNKTNKNKKSEKANEIGFSGWSE